MLRRPAVQQWTAFDPDDDEEEDDEEDREGRDKEEDKLSDVEVTRAADDSQVSGPKVCMECSIGMIVRGCHADSDVLSCLVVF